MTQLVYSIIPPERAGEAAQLLVNSFFKDEPLSTALKMPPSQASRWLPSYIAKAVEYGASLMAVDAATNKIVGVIIHIVKTKVGSNLSMGDYLDPQKEPIFCQIGRLLGKLNADIVTPNGAERILTCTFLNVESSYGGKGIARELIERAEDVGLSLGFDSFQVDTTSEYSFKVYKKLGYETLREVKFTDIQDDGQRILQGIDMGAHTHARILYKIKKI